jgi:hypothetical protein
VRCEEPAREQQSYPLMAAASGGPARRCAGGIHAAESPPQRRYRMALDRERANRRQHLCAAEELALQRLRRRQQEDAATASIDLICHRLHEGLADEEKALTGLRNLRRLPVWAAATAPQALALYPPSAGHQRAAVQRGLLALSGVMSAQLGRSVSVQQEGCGALALAASPEREPALVTAGSVLSVVAAMGAHPLASGMQAAACRALGALARSGEDLRRLAMEAGLQLVCHAMRVRYTSCRERMFPFCRAVWRATIQLGPQYMVDGLSQLCVALPRQGHRSSLGVQQCGCEALTAMLASDGTAARTIYAAGGARCIAFAVRVGVTRVEFLCPVRAAAAAATPKSAPR